MSWQSQPGSQQSVLSMQSVWREFTAPDGRTYYHNRETNQTVWDKPEELLTAGERILKQCPWKEYTNADGKRYYSHSETKESKWEMPEEYIATLERAKEADAASAASPPNNAASVSPVPPETKSQTPEPKPFVPETKPFTPPVEPDRSVIVFASQEAAEKAFIELLAESGVRPDWTWEQALRVIITHPHYKALKTLAEKKAAFHKYSNLSPKEHRDNAYRKIHDDFFEMLQRRGDITGSTRWRQAVEMLASEPAFNAVKDLRQRESFYDEYIYGLRQKERETFRENRKASLEKFSQLLRKLPKITAHTTWKEGQPIFQAHPDFSLASFKGMESLDFLALFEDYVKELEKDEDKIRQRRLDIKRRRERKNRDAFKSLLKELKEKGQITARTRWMDIYPIISKDERYTNMLGQPGSTPLELFWDTLEDLEEVFYQQRRTVYDVLKDKSIEVHANTEYDHVIPTLLQDNRIGDKLSEDTLKMVIDHIKHKAAHKQKEELRKQEKRLRRKKDDLRYVMKKLEPPVQLTDTWEQVAPRLEEYEEFKALDDDARQEAFQKFMRRLKEKQEGKSDDEEDDESRSRKDDTEDGEAKHSSRHKRRHHDHDYDRQERSKRSKRSSHDRDHSAEYEERSRSSSHHRSHSHKLSRIRDYDDPLYIPSRRQPKDWDAVME
ncbi:hypothetical protein BZG36_03886 [Bifiguratus adelaidae]|uniref:Pre-mRNA-processing protein prp40 n=1 Tax=Bifiguratus adelaidae TaxID=1938954 RepID=A0A261XXU1_9FUNG|nr:hypothetical protein BZG36_03886 [Bifiguratus adelaidae]